MDDSGAARPAGREAGGKNSDHHAEKIPAVASEKQALLAKATRLEGKLLYVKAAEVYLSLEMREKAAECCEKAGAYDKAIAIFEKLGKKEDADRCRAKRDASSTGQTWQDLQSEFQRDKGNPL